MSLNLRISSPEITSPMTTLPIPPGLKGFDRIFSRLIATRNLFGFLSNSAHKYGDIVRLDKCTYLINHPDFIEYVLTNTNNAFHKISEDLGDARRFWGNGLLKSQGEVWHRQRRLIQPMFHHNQIASHAEIMVAYTTRMLDSWRDGETRDVHKDLMQLTLQITAKTILGADIADDMDDMRAALHATMQLLDNPAQLAVSIPTPSKERFHEAVNRLDEIIYEIIKQHRTSGHDTADVLSMLLAARDEDGNQMTDQELRDEIATILRAGHKNTAIVMAWTWHLLSQHPDVEAKLIAELEEVLGGRPPSFADLPRLRYTEMVLNETMRLYPLYPITTRAALQDCAIGGYHIPAGTLVVMSAWLMHRDLRYFDRPEEFNPDRWANRVSKQLPKYAYFPFGGGPRYCVAKSYAMMEAVLLVATIAQKFRLTLSPNHPVTAQDSSSGLQPKNGVKVTLVKR